MKKHIFVSGGTGFQGRPLVDLLSENGHKITILSRNSDNTDTIPNFNIVKGGFEDMNALNSALNDVDVAVFTLPLMFDMDMAISMTNNFIEAAQQHQVPHIIFNSSFDLPSEKTGMLAIDIKVEVKEMFDASELNVTTLSPDIYIDNLTAPWSIPLILEQGILPYPVKSGQKIPWISHSDLAKFIAQAIEMPQTAASTMPIGGNLFTGEEIAAAISHKIGKPVQFVALTPDEFEKNIAPNFGDLAAHEISNLYRYVESNMDRIQNKDFTSIHNLLKVKPQSLSEWIDSVNWSK